MKSSDVEGAFKIEGGALLRLYDNVIVSARVGSKMIVQRMGENSYDYIEKCKARPLCDLARCFFF